MRKLDLVWYKKREINHVQGDDLDIPLRASRVYERVEVMRDDNVMISGITYI